MTKRKIYLTVTTLLISFIVLVGCSPKEIRQTSTPTIHTITSGDINPKEVEWVKRVGGLATSKWKVLFASKDYDAINKIITLVNSADRSDFNEKDYEAIGYPVSIEIRLQNNVVWRITPLFKVVSHKLQNGGTESTATPYKDRVVLDIEDEKQQFFYTLTSEQLASYVLKGADQDMPFVTGFSFSSDTIKPGQMVYISGDGSTEKDIEIYITDGNPTSNENYLIAKVPTRLGAWKWEGTINGRTIKTIDGKEVNLLKDKYFFEVGEGSRSNEGGTIDLTGAK